MKSILGACGIADLSGDPVHVLIVGETDAGRLLVQRVGCQEPVTVIDRTAFVEDLAIVPEQLSDQVRQAALDLGQAIERAKALAGSDRLLQQEDFQILHDKLDDMDRYPFASALIEHGVHVRTGAVDILTDPHDEGDSLGKHPEPWASPGSEGEARGVGQDPQDAPGSFPWTPADAGDGISNESATSEMDYPWVRKVEGEAAWDTALLPQIDKAIEEGGGWANMKRLPGGETVIWDMIDRGILEEEGGFVRRKQPEDEHEAEMGWSGTELTTNERWAQDNETIASVSMMDLAKHPLGRPKHDLEKDSDANTPSGRDRGLNPSVHEEIGEAYRDQNQWEDPDMHLGAPSRRSYIATASMRDLIAMEGTPYQTNVPIAEGEGEGVHDEVDLEEVNIQPHASRTAEFRTPTSVEDCKRAIQRAEKAKRKAEAELTDARSAGYEIGIRMWEERVAEYDAAIAHFERWMTEHGHEAQLDDSIGIAGDKFEDEGTGEALDPEDDVPVPKDFGLMASMSMREIIAQEAVPSSGGGDWWGGASYQQQLDYIKLHPKTKKKPTKGKDPRGKTQDTGELAERELSDLLRLPDDWSKASENQIESAIQTARTKIGQDELAALVEKYVTANERDPSDWDAEVRRSVFEGAYYLQRRDRARATQPPVAAPAPAPEKPAETAKPPASKAQVSSAQIKSEFSKLYPGSALSDRGAQALSEMVSRSGIPLDTIVQTFAGGPESKITSVKETKAGLEVTAKLMHEGKPAGEIIRTLEWPDSVKHDLIKLNADQQGKGLGLGVYSQQMQMYHKIGIKKVHLEPAWDGPYVWPKFGFSISDPDEVKETQSRWKKALGPSGKARGVLARLGISEEQIQKLAKAKTTYEMTNAVVKTNRGVEIPLGKLMCRSFSKKDTAQLTRGIGASAVQSLQFVFPAFNPYEYSLSLGSTDPEYRRGMEYLKKKTGIDVTARKRSAQIDDSDQTVDDSTDILQTLGEDDGGWKVWESPLTDEDSGQESGRSGSLFSVSMQEIIAQGVDNRMMSEDVFTDPLEDTEDKAIPRPPEDEPVRYQRAPGPA